MEREPEAAGIRARHAVGVESGRPFCRQVTPVTWSQRERAMASLSSPSPVLASLHISISGNTLLSHRCGTLSVLTSSSVYAWKNLGLRA